MRWMGVNSQHPIPSHPEGWASTDNVIIMLAIRYPEQFYGWRISYHIVTYLLSIHHHQPEAKAEATLTFAEARPHHSVTEKLSRAPHCWRPAAPRSSSSYERYDLLICYCGDSARHSHFRLLLLHQKHLLSKTTMMTSEIPLLHFLLIRWLDAFCYRLLPSFWGKCTSLETQFISNISFLFLAFCLSRSLEGIWISILIFMSPVQPSPPPTTIQLKNRKIQL